MLTKNQMKGMVVVGNLLVWATLLLPLIFAILRLFSGAPFQFDYLMPAELFLLVVLGGGVLLAAANLSHRRQRWIGWALGAGLALLIGGQALAVASGLATGEIEPAGLPWMLVLGSMLGYVLAVLALGIGGLLLARDLFTAEK